MKIKIKKRIHKGWKEYQNIKKIKPDFKLKNIFGKYQYIYSDGKSEISLVYLDYGDIYDNPFWEIFCIKGDLFIDVIRFKTQEEADETIRLMLKGGKKRK